MKKIIFISGFLTGLLLMLFFTGIIHFTNDINRALTKGNQLYAAAKYEEALNAYKKGLEVNPEDPKLNYNSGQASYCLKDYQGAIQYYSKAPDKIEKYLHSGNSSLRLGDSSNDDQKQQHYQQALETYKQGILRFPENIELKYNYEYVKSKIEQQQKDNQNSQQDNQENEDNQQDNQENQSQDNQQNENNQQDSQENQSQDNKQNEQDEKEQENTQTGESQQEDNQEQNGTDSQNQPSPQPEQNENKSVSENKDQNNNQDNSSQNGTGSSQSGQEGDELEQAVKVLEMLEKQEEDSLKNNQEAINQGKEEEHDW